MTNLEALTLILAQVGEMIQFMLPIVAVCSVLKIIFDTLYNFLFNITSRKQ